MLEQSRTDLADASTSERAAAEIIALRYLASELEQDLMPAGEAAKTAQAHKDAGDETWLRAVYGILSGLRSAAKEGYGLRT